MEERKKVVVIAEAGVNHNGRMDLAEKLIDVAAKAGADYVKFQAFKADNLVSKEAQKAAYQIENMQDGDERQYEMLRKLEISQDFHRKLITYCRQKGVGFLSSPFDTEGIDMLVRLGLSIIKVPSGEITNLPYLIKLGKLNAEVILSTGMATLGEIETALNILEREGTAREKVTVLHCNTDYPTKFEDVNLRAMNTIRKALGVRVGYSDHTPGIEVPIAATAAGAGVIEKHFTLDRAMEGPDHKASLEPDELKAMIRSIRNIEKSMGSGIKQPSLSEQKNREIVRKSIHLKRKVSGGSRLKEDDLIMLRPGDGISPMELPRILGKETKADMREGHKLQYSDLIL